MVAVVVELFKENGVWRLNQQDAGLLGEPLVFGMERIVDKIISRTNIRQTRFDVTLSSEVLEDPNGVLIRECEDAGGYWYVSEIDEEKGWLGLAGLQLIFEKAPKRIYCRAEVDASGFARSS